LLSILTNKATSATLASLSKVWTILENPYLYARLSSELIWPVAQHKGNHTKLGEHTVVSKELLSLQKQG